jgi:hypothetical protein
MLAAVFVCRIFALLKTALWISGPIVEWEVESDISSKKSSLDHYYPGRVNVDFYSRLKKPAFRKIRFQPG